MHRYFIAAVAALVLAGCGSSKEANKSNFKAAIQAYLNSKPGACVALPQEQTPFKIEKNGFDRAALNRADALVEVGLLTRRDADVPPYAGATRLVPGFEYDLSAQGKKHLVKEAAGSIGKWDGFCAGKYKVVEVTNFSEPGDAFGLKVSQVNYRYKVEGPASWAGTPAIRSAYPHLARDLGDDPSDKAVLVATNDGWMHERLFKAKAH